MQAKLEKRSLSWLNNLWLCLLFALFGLILFVALLLFFPRLTQGIANTLLTDQQLECLEYHPAGFAQLNIEKVCVKTAAASVKLSGAVWNLSDNYLNITNLVITLLENRKSSDDNAPTSIAIPVIPKWLPQLAVKDIQINTDALTESVALELQQPAPNRFVLESDWVAEIELLPGKIKLMLNWKMADFSPYLPDEAQQQIPFALLQSPVQSHFVLQGNQLDSEHQLNIDVAYSQKCTFHIVAKGKAVASVDLRDQRVIADLAQLPVGISATDCPEPKAVPAALQLEALKLGELKLLFAEPLVWQNRQLQIPAVQLHNIASQSTQGLALDVSGSDVLISQRADTKSNAHNKPQGNATQTPATQIVGRFNLLAHQSDLLELSAQTDIKLDLAAQSLSYALKLRQLDVFSAEFEHQKYTWKGLRLFAKGELDSQQGAQITGNLELGMFTSDQLHLKKFTSELSVRGGLASKTPLAAQAKVQLAELQHPLFSAVDIRNSFKLESPDLKIFSGKGISNIEKFQGVDIAAGSLQVEHWFKYQLESKELASQHKIQLADGFKLEANASLAKVSISLEQQPLTHFNNIVQQPLPDLKITDGTVSADMEYYIRGGVGKGKLALNNIAAQFKEYSLSGVNFQPHISLNSGGLQLVPTTLSVTNINVGVSADNIQMQLSAKDNQLRLNSLNGQLLGGRFAVEQAWLDRRDQALQLDLIGISMADILALQEQSGVKSAGINIQGQLQGKIPIVMKNGKISVEHAQVSNMLPGVLKIEENSAFNALKAQQPEIGSQLALLEHVEFDSLKSDLSMTEEGDVFLDMAIKGINPEQQQPLNFNYTHQQNLYTLLKSLRLTEQVEQQLEKRTQKE